MDLSTIEGIYIDDLINVPLAKGTKGDKGEQGDIGIGIMYIEANEDKTITVHYTDETTQVIQIPNSIKGDKGDKPVKGVDYWTEEDKKELVGDILEEANTKITNLENTKADKKKVWNLTLDTNWNGKPVYTKTSDTTLYNLTKDTAIDSNKTYYTAEPVYTKVDSPVVADISKYYEESSGTYTKTTDTSINTSKTYYILSSTNYTKVETPVVDDISKYYEFTTKSYYTTDGTTYTKVETPVADDISNYYEVTGEEAPYIKKIEVEGLKDTETALLYPVYSDDLTTRATEKEEYSKISVVNSSLNKLTIICDEEKPTINLNVRLEVDF